MLEPVRFAVVGEGRDEHGSSPQGPPLRPMLEGSLRGGLVTLVARLLSERYGRVALPVGWLAPVPNRRSQPLSAVELLCDGNLLPHLLNGLLRPVALSPMTFPAAELVVLSVDLDRKQAFERTLSRIPQELRDRVIPLVFEPEFETLFTCCKKPLEDALGLPRCFSNPPARGGKESLQQWVQRYGSGKTLDAALRERVARYLDLGPDSPLEELPVFQQLAAQLSLWRATAINAKGHP